MTRLLLPLLLLLAAPVEAGERTALWELSGDRWSRGTHDGTVGDRGALTLAPDAPRGAFTIALPAARCDSVLLSLNPDPFPAGARVETAVRARVSTAPGTWTPWFPLGDYGAGDALPRSGALESEHGRLLTDVVAAARGDAFVHVELRLVLSRSQDRAPRVRRAAVSLKDAAVPRPRAAPLRAAWGKVLDVPRRSQKTEAAAIAGRICSPTSLSMVLAYWGDALPTPEVARRVYDRAADIYGNWSFNVAFAGERGFAASAAYLSGLRDLEEEIVAGRPVVISHRYAAGELSNSPVRATEGHLIVVVGFTETGDVVVNDPAADPRRDQSIRCVYARAELERTWQDNAGGVAYLIRPGPK